MEDISSSQDISDLEDILDLPHQITLKKIEDDRNKNNFINATIYCLTNNKSFIRQSSSYLINKKKYPIFFNLIDSIGNYLINKDEEELTKIKDYQTKFVNFIISDDGIIKDKSNHEPRVLIDCIFNLLMKTDNYEEQKSICNILDETIEKSNIEINSFSLNISNLEKKDYEPNKYKLYLKKIRGCKNENCLKKADFYKAFQTLHFKLYYNKNKVYTLKDCFEDFIKTENEEIDYECPYCNTINYKVNSDSSFYFLPNDIIILIYYEDGHSCQDFYYNFDDIIDFSEFSFINDKFKNRKYLLSSIIACKNPKDQENELFYTLCRNDTTSTYFVYKSKLIKKDLSNIDNKIKKSKDDEFDEKRGFPYVLIYTSLKNN